MEITSIIIKPKVTEKTQIIRAFKNPKMSFYVHPKANKHQIVKAFETLFGIKPSCVNVLNEKPAPTRVTSKSRKNYTKLFKVAYVTVSSEDYLNLQKKSENLENSNNELDLGNKEEEVQVVSEGVEK